MILLVPRVILFISSSFSRSSLAAAAVLTLPNLLNSDCRLNAQVLVWVIIPVSCAQVLVWVIVGGQKYHMVNEKLTLDVAKLRAAVGPAEQADALGVPADDCLRLFEMYTAIVIALTERCYSQPNPAGYGADLTPLLTRIKEPLGADNPPSGMGIGGPSRYWSRVSPSGTGASGTPRVISSGPPPPVWREGTPCGIGLEPPLRYGAPGHPSRYWFRAPRPRC